MYTHTHAHVQRCTHTPLNLETVCELDTQTQTHTNTHTCTHTRTHAHTHTYTHSYKHLAAKLHEVWSTYIRNCWG